jgi:hypothetical protein
VQQAVNAATASPMASDRNYLWTKILDSKTLTTLKSRNLQSMKKQPIMGKVDAILVLPNGKLEAWVQITEEMILQPVLAITVPILKINIFFIKIRFVSTKVTILLKKTQRTLALKIMSKLALSKKNFKKIYF